MTSPIGDQVGHDLGITIEHGYAATVDDVRRVWDSLIRHKPQEPYDSAQATTTGAPMSLATDVKQAVDWITASGTTVIDKLTKLEQYEQNPVFRDILTAIEGAADIFGGPEAQVVVGVINGLVAAKTPAQPAQPAA